MDFMEFKYKVFGRSPRERMMIFIYNYIIKLVIELEGIIG